MYIDNKSEILFLTTCKRSLGQGNVFTDVCLPIGGLCMMSHPVRLPSPLFILGWSLSLVTCSFQGESLCPGESLYRGSLSGGVPPIRKVGDRHPTGMLSCFELWISQGCNLWGKTFVKIFFLCSLKLQIAHHNGFRTSNTCQLIENIWTWIKYNVFISVTFDRSRKKVNWYHWPLIHIFFSSEKQHIRNVVLILLLL